GRRDGAGAAAPAGRDEGGGAGGKERRLSRRVLPSGQWLALPLAEHPGGFSDMQNRAAHVVFRTPKVADFHVIDEMAQVHRRDMSGLGSPFGGKVFNGRGNGARVALALRQFT